MSGPFSGRVVAVTGAARGQGRSHVLRFAAEGADVIAIDICEDIPGLSYRLATKEDLDETVEAASAHGTRVLGYVADVRILPRSALRSMNLWPLSVASML